MSSSTKIGEGLICIIHSVSPSSLGGDRGTFIFISITVYHPQVEMEDGLISIIHRYFPSTFSVEVGEGLICVIHSVSPLQVGERLFAPPTKCIAQPNPNDPPPISTQARGRHTVDYANEPLPQFSPKLEGNTLWIIQMSPSPTSLGRYSIGDANEPLPNLHSKYRETLWSMQISLFEVKSRGQKSRSLASSTKHHHQLQMWWKGS